jgi:hypothetical protein
MDLRYLLATEMACLDSTRSEPVTMNLEQPTSFARWITSSRSSSWACFPWYSPRKTGSLRLIPI